MLKDTEPLDSTYVADKRQQLIALRERLQSESRAAEIEEAQVRTAASQQPQQFEDDAQKLDSLETQGELVNRSVVRLERIGRALTKIDEGTYGYSDVSGLRIPEARLDAMPDAVTTLKEQEAAERG